MLCFQETNTLCYLVYVIIFSVLFFVCFIVGTVVDSIVNGRVFLPETIQLQCLHQKCTLPSMTVPVSTILLFVTTLTPTTNQPW